jgi:hypothetical protein
MRRLPPPDVAPTVGVGLSVAVGTEQPEVDPFVVGAIPIHMVELERSRSVLPLPDATHRAAALEQPGRDQSFAQTRRRSLVGRVADEDLLEGPLSRGRRGTTSSPTLTAEVVGRETKGLDASAKPSLDRTVGRVEAEPSSEFGPRAHLRKCRTKPVIVDRDPASWSLPRTNRTSIPVVGRESEAEDVLLHAPPHLATDGQIHDLEDLREVPRLGHRRAKVFVGPGPSRPTRRRQSRGVQAELLTPTAEPFSSTAATEPEPPLDLAPRPSAVERGDQVLVGPRPASCHVRSPPSATSLPRRAGSGPTTSAAVDRTSRRQPRATPARSSRTRSPTRPAAPAGSPSPAARTIDEPTMTPSA